MNKISLSKMKNECCDFIKNKMNNIKNTFSEKRERLIYL